MDTEGYGGGNCFSLAPWMFSGYVGLYRRKKYVGGRPRGPRDRGRAPLSRGPPGPPPTSTPTLYIWFREKKSERRIHHVLRYGAAAKP